MVEDPSTNTKIIDIEQRDFMTVLLCAIVIDLEVAITLKFTIKKKILARAD
jgi:hypothetical protein